MRITRRPPSMKTVKTAIAGSPTANAVPRRVRSMSALSPRAASSPITGGSTWFAIMNERPIKVTIRAAAAYTATSLSAMCEPTTQTSTCDSTNVITLLTKTGNAA